MDNPSVRLAERIIKRLIGEKLLSAGDERKMLEKLATGKLTADDWRLAVEIAYQREV